MPPPNSDALVKQIATTAKQRQWQVMTAESCTGGMVAAALSHAAGASDWFGGGVVVYGNALKQRLLNVPAATLAAHGAVSEQTAQAMCSGLVPLGADAGIAVTGIAGPSGGSDDKPVGTVCFGVHTPQRAHTLTKHFSGDRETVRAAATRFALQQLAAALSAGARA